MFHKLVYRPRVSRKAKPADLLARVEAVLREAGMAPRIRLCLEDGAASARSAVNRVVRQFPSLSAALTAGGQQGAMPLAVSTLDPPWTPHAPSAGPPEISPEMAGEIAAGIPRRWPLDSALFVLELPGWPGLAAPSVEIVPALPPGQPCPQWPAAYWRPAVCVSSAWRSSGRLNDIVAIVPLLPAPPPTAMTLPLPDAVVRVLQALGPRGTITVEAVRTTSEEEATSGLRARLAEMVAADEPHLQAIPAALTVSPAEPGSRPAGSPAVKAPLARAVREFGLEYVPSQSGQGIYVFAKQTPRGHELALNVDAAPMARTLWAYCSFRASGFSWVLPVPLAPGNGPQSLDPPERLAELLANLGRVLRHYESELLPGLEAQLGEGARWLRTAVRILG
jgi:hypothetical protein